jgi:hypothetical protein
MALHLSYARDTYRPPSAVVPNNDTASTPVEFDLAPAEGPDLARLKSIIVSTGGLVGDVVWTKEVQDLVVAAFHHGAPAFVQTVTAVRGLTVPAAMAVRVGLLAELPVHVPAGASAPVPNPEAPVPIPSGRAFAAICGFVPLLAMHIANEILKLTTRSGIDLRFFEPPSGSGGQETPGTTPGGAPPAPPVPDAPATAGSTPTTDRSRRGTSRRSRSH